MSFVKICNPTYSSEHTREYDSVFSTYAYPLSDFQKYAIEAILTGHHVLSCAHTGSGKTLAAEFAIQHFVGKGKKVIYTSPIKALSNQKYYEFTHKYPDISFGLLTGDIKTNPQADVLIMTTEILMNRLFFESGSSDRAIGLTGLSAFEMDIHTELSCVVFDEVHYINDSSRGHVWEQAIMMLPTHVQMIMLSATIDNPVGFAEWVAQCHSDTSTSTPIKQVWLASTDMRVVPLTHYVYYATTEEPFKKIKDKAIQTQIRETSNRCIPIMTADGKFQESTYHNIQSLHSIFTRERIFMKRKFVLNRLLETLRDPEKSYLQNSDKEMLPAIVFVFSRKQVEICAHEITTNLLEFDSKVPYVMRNECETIVRKFPNAKEFLELPEFNDLVGLLEKGIGIHHSGMIPVLREIVEIMISRKMIKVLFATESFAIGLDCPIRTAVFTSLQKYCTTGMRELYSHEYTQMAGRAGRRGIDTVGHVIHLNNLFHNSIPLYIYKQILGGGPQKLVSKFHITYDIVLGFIANGKTSKQDMIEYINHTMFSKEIHQKKESMESQQQVMKTAYETKLARLNTLRTPVDRCERYLHLLDTAQMMPHKKRKEAEREMQHIQDEYRHCLKADIEIHKEVKEMKKELETNQSYVNVLTTRMNDDLDFICSMLEQYGCIETVVDPDHDTNVENNENRYNITEIGKSAIHSAEIHSVLVTKIINETDWFSEFTEKELTIYFSCFTQLKVEEEFKRARLSSSTSTISKKCRDVIQRSIEILETLEETEIQARVDTGIEYRDMMHYDLTEEITEWWNCQTEQECKYFIQTKISDRGISIGDFTKAILKITTISREWMAICESMGNIEKMQCLSHIEPNLLKYITTSQSLYI